MTKNKLIIIDTNEIILKMDDTFLSIKIKPIKAIPKIKFNVK
jgi:hypothetical protein